MKIRNGFVSNSSSSSFVMFGNTINELKEYNENLYLMDDGGRGYEGQLYFKLTKEIFDYIVNEKPELNDVTFIQQLASFNESNGEAIEEDLVLPKGTETYVFLVDQNTPNDLEQFKEWFIEEI